MKRYKMSQSWEPVSTASRSRQEASNAWDLGVGQDSYLLLSWVQRSAVKLPSVLGVVAGAGL